MKVSIPPKQITITFDEKEIETLVFLLTAAKHRLEDIEYPYRHEVLSFALELKKVLNNEQEN